MRVVDNCVTLSYHNVHVHVYANMKIWILIIIIGIYLFTDLTMFYYDLLQRFKNGEHNVGREKAAYQVDWSVTTNDPSNIVIHFYLTSYGKCI